MFEFRSGKLKIISAVLVLSGSFLFLGNVKSVSATFLNSYNKAYNGTLAATEWNNLALDFLNKSGAAIMTGPLGIGTTTAPVSGLYVNGPIYGSNFSGGSFTGFIDAANVMGGSGSSFGSNSGGGNYSFPANLGIGTTNPTAKLTTLTTTGIAALSLQNSSNSANATTIMKLGEYIGRTDGNGGTVFTNTFINPSSNWSSTFQIQTNTGTALNTGIFLNQLGSVGIGTTAPLDKLSIGNAGAAPAGSPNTGHNFTSTYLSTDDYALVNYGILKTMTMNASNTAAVISGGDLNMGGFNILNVNKLTVNTIDPLYDINGVKYSTYASSISGGVKEEVVGKVAISSRAASDNKEYEKVIDFAKEKEGSDLWVWRQVIDFAPENVEVFITPFGKFANTYYSIENNKLIFRSDRPVTISYRLIGSRFDWRKWPTKALNQSEKGMKVE